MEFEDVLTNQPVVLDCGSGFMKAGFAGEEQPKCFFPNYLGQPKHTRVMAGAIEGNMFFGSKAEQLRGLLKLKYPMQHGIVQDWEAMERIYQYLYSEVLNVLPEEHPVLLTEAPLNPKKNREQMCQLFFETFNVPALYISEQAVLSLYASGRTTGLILDIGDGVSHVIPVYEGFAIPNAIQRMDLAGRDITNHFQLLLRKRGIHFQTSSEMEIVRQMKEKLCYVTMHPEKEEKEMENFEQFVLPDGQKIQIGKERFLAPEILFQPMIIGSESVGIHQLLIDSVQKVDMDLRPGLLSNIVLSGGTTLTKGLPERLLEELRMQMSRELKLKIYAPPERKYSTWIGGSILASLGTFKKIWVSAEEYQEDPDVIHKKMF